MNAEARRQALLAAIRSEGGRWTTRRVMDLLREMDAPQRSTARKALQDLWRRGWLIARGAQNDLYYLPSGKAKAATRA